MLPKKTHTSEKVCARGKGESKKTQPPDTAKSTEERGHIVIYSFIKKGPGNTHNEICIQSNL